MPGKKISNVSVLVSDAKTLKITIFGRFAVYDIVYALWDIGMDLVTSSKTDKRYIVDPQNDVVYKIKESGFDLFKELDETGVARMKPHRGISSYVSKYDLMNK